MTLLIAVSNVDRDAELIESGRALAAAAGWDVLAVHVREAEWGLGGGDIDGVELLNLEGEPADALVTLISNATIDCVGVGLSLADGSPFGSIARSLLEHFSHPILLVRPGMRPVTELQRLLVPLEGTPSSSAAMLFVESALCVPGREITMLHVATGSAPAEAGSLPAPRFIDQEQYEWSDWQDEFSMRFSQRAEGCRHRVDVVVGDPPGAIAEEARARDVDLIVLTWKGSFAAGHGPVVRRLLDVAPCPLVLVPSTWTSGEHDVAASLGAHL